MVPPKSPPAGNSSPPSTDNTRPPPPPPPRRPVLGGTPACSEISGWLFRDFFVGLIITETVLAPREIPCFNRPQHFSQNDFRTKFLWGPKDLAPPRWVFSVPAKQNFFWAPFDNSRRAEKILRPPCVFSPPEPQIFRGLVLLNAGHPPPLPVPESPKFFFWGWLTVPPECGWGGNRNPSP